MLRQARSAWGTPTTRDWKDAGATFDTSVEMQDVLAKKARLAAQAHGTTLNGCPAETVSNAQLNPEFTRWLMGLPTEWGSCAPTETPSALRSL